MIKNKFFRIIDKISTYLLIPFVMIGILVSLFVLVTRNHGDIARVGNISFAKILSSSMKSDEHSDFDKGKIVALEKVNYHDLAIGDIIAFYEYVENKDNEFLYSRIIFHRIIEILEDKDGEVFVRTKGDNNYVPDNPIHHDFIIGRYTSNHKLLLSGVEFFTSKLAIFMFVIVPASVLFFMETLTLSYLLDSSEETYEA